MTFQNGVEEYKEHLEKQDLDKAYTNVGQTLGIFYVQVK